MLSSSQYLYRRFCCTRITVTIAINGLNCCFLVWNLHDQYGLPHKQLCAASLWPSKKITLLLSSQLFCFFSSQLFCFFSSQLFYFFPLSYSVSLLFTCNLDYTVLQYSKWHFIYNLDYTVLLLICNLDCTVSLFLIMCATFWPGHEQYIIIYIYIYILIN